MSGTEAEEPRSEDFELLVRSSFTISGLGTVAAGPVMSGCVREGDPLVLRKPDDHTRMTRALRIEMIRMAGLVRDHVPIFVDGLSSEDISPNDLLRAPDLDARWGARLQEATVWRMAIEDALDTIPDETEREIVRLAKQGRRTEAIDLLTASSPLTAPQLEVFLGYYGPLQQEPRRDAR
jgi:translation elongation factor EF-Tu-like GTPase